MFDNQSTDNGRCDDGTMAAGRAELWTDQGRGAVRGGGAAAGGDRAAQPAPSLRDGHLPGGGDRLEGVRLAHERGRRVVLLPAVPYGTETNQMRFPMAMNLNPSTLARVIADLVDSLEAHGVSRCLILNGHGGNDLKWVLRELHRSSKVHLFLCNWYKIVSDVYSTIFDAKDDHAGEMETSLGLAHFGGLVELERADAGAVRPTRFEAINRGWIEITRPWHLLTTNSGAGDPRAATAAKGEALDRPAGRADRRVPPRPRRQPR